MVWYASLVDFWLWVTIKGWVFCGAVIWSVSVSSDSRWSREAHRVSAAHPDGRTEAAGSRHRHGCYQQTQQHWSRSQEIRWACRKIFHHLAYQDLTHCKLQTLILLYCTKLNVGCILVIFLKSLKLDIICKKIILFVGSTSLSSRFKKFPSCLYCIMFTPLWLNAKPCSSSELSF